MSVAPVAPKPYVMPADGVVVARRPHPAELPTRPAAPSDTVSLSQPAKPALRPVKFGDVAKVGGGAAAGFVGGAVATFAVDLFTHFGNNGGKAWSGGVYTGLALAGAGVAGYLAYRHVQKARAEH
jgi:hypothetical protein